MWKASIFLLFLTITLACKKKEAQAIKSPNSPNCVVFSGITAVDVVGNLMDTPDTTDWTFDDSWSNKERRLFPNYDSLYHKEPTVPAVYVSEARPNPVTAGEVTGFIVDFVGQKEHDKCEIKIVTECFKVLKSSEITFTKANQRFPMYFQIKTHSATDSIARLYYLFTRNDSCIYKGHGDLTWKDWWSR